MRESQKSIRSILLNLDRPRKNILGLVLLVATQLALGIAQLQIVPFGSSVDELYHFGSGKNVFSACLRDTSGLSWSLYSDVPWEEPRQHSQMGLLRQWVGEDWELIDADSPIADPCSVILQPHYLKSLAYYFLIATPMAVLDALPAATAIPIGRLVTLLLGLLVTTLTYHMSLELFPKHLFLAMGAGISIGLNHHMSGVMTGINTDAGAAFAVTLVMWSLARIHRRDYSLGRVAWLGLAICLCFLTKTTAWVALPVAVIWLWAKLSSRWRWGSGVGIAACATGILIWMWPVRWSVPAHWFVRSQFRTDMLLTATRSNIDTPLGRYALSVDPSKSPTGYLQFLPEKQLDELRGQPMSVSGWVLAPEGTQVSFPAIDSGEGIVSDLTIGTGAWQFQSMNVQLSADAAHLAVLLPAADSSAAVHYDGLMLISGSYTAAEPPEFSSILGQSGHMGEGRKFINLLRNPSAEQSWPYIDFAGLTLQLGRWKFEPPEFLVPSPLNPPLWSLLSWERTGMAWRQLPGWVFSMYWSGFGGVNPGLTRLQLLPFAILSLASVVGLLGFTNKLPYRSWHLSSHEILSLFLLLSTAVLIWGIVPMRADIYPNRAAMFAFAGVRHVLTGFSVTVTLFVLGLLRVLPVRYHRWAVAALALLLFLNTIYLLLVVQIPFYDCPYDPKTHCLVSIR